MPLTREQILTNPAYSQVFKVEWLDANNEHRAYSISLSGKDKVADENEALNVACSKLEDALVSAFGEHYMDDWMHVATTEIL